MLDGGKWSQFRLPISDFTYMPKHGWYTEWPRIREVGGTKMLMNMHGGWFDFPRSFSTANSGGLRPIADYLKITGDFCGWKSRIVFGCDDAALEDTPSAMQSQSNLWFSRWSELSNCGQPSGFGGPWIGDPVKAGGPSAPYIFAGYSHRIAHLANDTDTAVAFKFETDAKGDGTWHPWRAITVAPHAYAFPHFSRQHGGGIDPREDRPRLHKSDSLFWLWPRRRCGNGQGDVHGVGGYRCEMPGKRWNGYAAWTRCGHAAIR